MIKIRLKFNKDDAVKYISHLDLMRTFNRAFNRAKLPVMYSLGFNPHPILSFALPLAVGVTSEAEYMDVELEKEVDIKEMVERLNQALPNGIRVMEARKFSDNQARSFNDISLADYIVKVETKSAPAADIASKITNILNGSELITEKKGKKGMKQVNIIGDIHELFVIEVTDQDIILKMRLSAGNVSNLKPDLVLKALEKYIEGFEVEFAQVHRIAQFFADKNNII